jgi:hypothetical protein
MADMRCSYNKEIAENYHLLRSHSKQSPFFDVDYYQIVTKLPSTAYSVAAKRLE